MAGQIRSCAGSLSGPSYPATQGKGQQSYRRSLTQSKSKIGPGDWHGTCCGVCALPPGRGVCEHADTGIQGPVAPVGVLRAAAALAAAWARRSQEQGCPQRSTAGCREMKRSEKSRACPAFFVQAPCQRVPRSRLTDCDDDRELVSTAVLAWPLRSDLDDPCRPGPLEWVRGRCVNARIAYYRGWHAVCSALSHRNKADHHHEQHRHHEPQSTLSAP